MAVPSIQSRTPVGPAFIAFVAGCMSMVAMSIDMILPAFDDIRLEFGLASDSNTVTWIITGYFVGLSVGQLFYGALSDRYGRKPLLFVGLSIYALGTIGSAFAPSLPVMIAARALWGFGAAGPRSLAIAMVRDRTSGDQMARTMSFVMTLFLIVPVLAPGIGAIAIHFTSWEAAFLLPGVGALILAVWATRMPETLAPEHRRAVQPRALLGAAGAVLRCRPTAMFGVAVAFLFGTMASYLASSELIIDETFNRKNQFPIIFGVIAALMGVGSFSNGRLVMQLGVARLLRISTIGLVTCATIFFVVTIASSGSPPFPVFVVLMGMLLAFVGLTLPNANTAAMEPMGAIAGMAASILGVLMTAGGAFVGAVLDRFADGSVTPLASGMLVCTVCASLLITGANRRLATATVPA